jgi:hydroxymethylpyrimidine pyrophosphatase-like HAD family hydrolase
MTGPYRGIFVSDLDGTLLRGGRISEGDLKAFRGLGEQGIMRVIATGRSLYSAKSCLADDFPADYLILSTGNQIVNWTTQKVLRSAFLSGQEVRDICLFLQGLGLSFMVHEDFPHNHRFAYHRGHKNVADFDRRLALYGSHGQKKTSDPAARAASQIVVIVDGSDAAMHDRIYRELACHSVIRATSPLDGQSVWIEIFAADVSKASGIKHLVDHYGLHGAPSAAIGNDHNDRDMLELVRMPFKVADAFLGDEDKYITTPENSDAVAFAIARYMESFHAGMTDA